MRQCEFKKCYDPNTDMYVTKHIYGEGISDVLKSKSLEELQRK